VKVGIAWSRPVSFVEAVSAGYPSLEEHRVAKGKNGMKQIHTKTQNGSTKTRKVSTISDMKPGNLLRNRLSCLCAMRGVFVLHIVHISTTEYEYARVVVELKTGLDSRSQN